MENKINIAELLKNCSQGMELDCSMFENITFEEVITVRGFDDKKRVKIILSTHYSDGTKDEISLTEFGTYTDDETAKCVIFPKGKTTWEGFVPPCQFKDGDVISDEQGDIAIFKQMHKIYTDHIDFYCGLAHRDSLFILKNDENQNWGKIKYVSFATEKEKQKLFDAIKANGYKWNAETKTLEKLEVKKFDISILVPFESRVLVREKETDVWQPAFYGFFNQKNRRFYTTNSGTWMMCIPYHGGTKYLTGTTNDCDEYYKTWE